MAGVGRYAELYIAANTAYPPLGDAEALLPPVTFRVRQPDSSTA